MEHYHHVPPQPGMNLKYRHGKMTATVSEVFPAGQYPGMILEWRDEYGIRKGQAFTTRDWQQMWTIQQNPEQPH